jgi:hypothetical protein
MRTKEWGKEFQEDFGRSMYKVFTFDYSDKNPVEN